MKKLLVLLFGLTMLFGCSKEKELIILPLLLQNDTSSTPVDSVNDDGTPVGTPTTGSTTDTTVVNSYIDLVARTMRVKVNIADCPDANGYLDYSYDGTNRQRWYVTDSGGIHTFWSNRRLYLHVNGVCKKTDLQLKISAINIYGPLSPNYRFYNVDVKVAKKKRRGVVKIKHTVASVMIAASETDVKTGSVLIPLRKGKNMFVLMWTNDNYKKGVYDANINIRKVEVTDGSGLAAFINQNLDTKGMVYLSSIIILVAGLGLLGITLVTKFKNKEA